MNTIVLPESRRSDVIQRIRTACQTGAQAYWVCTLIEESELLQCQAAEVTARELSDELSDIRIALVHGRMTSKEKTAVMARFKSGEIDLLVATTVIEVGVDVANASLMVIENSERLGLSQLHQLRGRVGRGAAESHCLLMYHPPLGETGRKRLNVMRESNDGFYIADQDLLIRGPGELLGSRQSGSVEFRIADLIRDSHMLGEASSQARRLVKEQTEEATLLVQRWSATGNDLAGV